jgi:hypothetical protein
VPSIEIFAEAELPERYAWQAVACMREVWPSLFAGPLEWITRPADAGLSPHHFVLHRDGVLASYASVVRLTVEHAGERFGVHGLGNVLTPTPYRGRGYASRVLGAVNDWLDAGGADVAALFCAPSLEGFYAGLGWMPCPGGTRLGDRADSRPYDESRMMRFLSGRARAAREGLAHEALYVTHVW